MKVTHVVAQHPLHQVTCAFAKFDDATLMVKEVHLKTRGPSGGGGGGGGGGSAGKPFATMLLHFVIPINLGFAS